MTVQLELWHLISLLLAFFACVAGFGKVLLSQIERRLDDKFSSQEEARQEAARHWDQKFQALEKSSGEWVRLEREFLELKADLPRQYVMREDFVRNQTIIEAKLDGLALKLENAQLKGALKP